jgi:hypothetical protein
MIARWEVTYEILPRRSFPTSDGTCWLRDYPRPNCSESLRCLLVFQSRFCALGGDWRKVVILGQEPKPTARFFAEPEPAYLLEGSELTINFTANVCDDYTMMLGHMTETEFTGRYQFTGLMSVKEIGAAYGARVLHYGHLNSALGARPEPPLYRQVYKDMPCGLLSPPCIRSTLLSRSCL